MNETKTYVGLFIISPDKAESIGDVTGSIGTIISENSGNIEKENMIGKKELSYPIQKKKEALYYELTFTASPDSVEKMMKQFRINTDILRILIENS